MVATWQELTRSSGSKGCLREAQILRQQVAEANRPVEEPAPPRIYRRSGMSLKQQEIARLIASRPKSKKPVCMGASNTPRFVQLHDGSPRLKVQFAGSMRLLKLSTTAENVARRLRSQSLLEDMDQPQKGLMASLGQIVNFRKDEMNYLQELFEMKHAEELRKVPITKKTTRKAATVNLKNFFYICSMFCKKGSEDSFLLERIFIVFQKKEDNVMSMHEFTSGLHQLCRGSNDQKLKLYFEMYDLDGCGSISMSELHRLFIHSPSCIGTTRKERNQWARDSCLEVFRIADKYMIDDDLSEEGFKFAIAKLPQILAAFDFGIKKSVGTSRDMYG